MFSEQYKLSNLPTALPSLPTPGLGTPLGISSPVGPVPTLAQGGTRDLAHWRVLEVSVLTEPGPNSFYHNDRNIDFLQKVSVSQQILQCLL